MSGFQKSAFGDMPPEYLEKMPIHSAQLREGRSKSKALVINALVALFSATTVLALTFAFWSQIQLISIPERSALLQPEDYLGDIPTEYRIYQGDPDLMRLDEIGDYNWNHPGKVIPEGGGFIYVLDPRKYDMIPSKPTLREQDPPGTEVYSVSVTHQLHCLSSLRHVMISRQKGLKVPHDREEHINHCFDYLRFALQCNSDTSLEAGKTECEVQGDGTSECHYHFNPAGSKHKCRNWDFMTDKLQGLRISNLTNTKGPPTYKKLGSSQPR